MTEQTFDIREHITIHVVIPEGDEVGYWVHTHGMVQFNKPDLEMVHVPGLFTHEASRILNSVAQKLTEGVTINPGQTVTLTGLDVRTLFLTGDTEHAEGDCLRIVEADLLHFCKCAKCGGDRDETH